jgi:hypothetical protein
LKCKSLGLRTRYRDSGRLLLSSDRLDRRCFVLAGVEQTVFLERLLDGKVIW